MNPPKRRKPNETRYAERALWAWLVWTCPFGVYQTWAALPDLQNTIASELPGVPITIDVNGVMSIVIPVYVVVAAIFAWFILKVGQGKAWARSSVLWGFVLQIFMMIIPPYHPLVEYLGDIPDVGLQAAALYWLYGHASRDWFDQPKK